MSILIYTIIDFHDATRTVKVSFRDESHAVIQLRQPFPTSKAELDLIVSQFAPATEVMAGRSATFDAGWLTPLIGNPQVCERLSLTPIIPAPPTAEEIAARLVAAERAYKQRIAKTLFDFGVTATNLFP